MKPLQTLPCLLLTLFAFPAGAQATVSQFPAVSIQQLTVGIRTSLQSNRGEAAQAQPPRGSGRYTAGTDSSGRSAARDIGIGAAIGGAIGIGAGVVASRRKQSIEVDVGTNAYVLLGFLSGAILGALTGAVVLLGR